MFMSLVMATIMRVLRKIFMQGMVLIILMVLKMLLILQKMMTRTFHEGKLAKSRQRIPRCSNPFCLRSLPDHPCKG